MSIDQDMLAKLQDGLEKVGLKRQMIAIINGKLSLRTKGDPLALPSEVRHLALKAAKTMTRRDIAQLIEGLVRELMIVMEEEVMKRRPRPAGPKSVWEEFPEELRPPQADQGGSEDIPRSPEEYYHYLGDFQSKNFGPLRFDEKLKRELAAKSAEVAEYIEKEYGLTPGEAANLTKMSFYDIFFLCDDSGSMRLGDRIQALGNTIQETTEWATKIERDGVSLRFLNDVRDSNDKYNNLSRSEQIEDLIIGTQFRGPTKLGTVLRKKVVQPLAEKAANTDGSIKPRIIFIITDGAPTGEYRNCLRDVILHAKTGEGLGAKFGQALTVFLFTIVGDDDGAKEFVSELKRDKSLESMIYTSTDPLNKVMARLSQEPDTIGYKKYLMRLFNAALKRQTK